MNAWASAASSNAKGAVDVWIDLSRLVEVEQLGIQTAFMGDNY